MAEKINQRYSYFITTKSGKTHEIGEDKINKYGWGTYAKNNPGATVRMRDDEGNDYDVPLTRYDDAVAENLHAFKMERYGELGVGSEELGGEQGGKGLKGEKAVKVEANDELGVGGEKLGVEKGEKGLKGEEAKMDVKAMWRGDIQNPETVELADAYMEGKVRPETKKAIAGAVLSAFAEEQSKGNQRAREQMSKPINGGFVPAYSGLHQAVTRGGEIAKATDIKPMIENVTEKILGDENKVWEAMSPYIEAGYDVEKSAELAVNDIADSAQSLIIDEYKRQNAPESTLTYIAGNAFRNSLVAQLAQGMARVAGGASGLNEQLKDEAYAQAGEKAGSVARVTSGVGTLLLDAPAFGGLGKMGGAVAKGVTDAVGRQVATKVIGATGKAGINAASRYVGGNIGMRMAQGSIGTGITLGSYDALGEALRGMRTDTFDVKEVLKRGSHGLGTGAAIGWITPASRYMSKDMSKAGKVMMDAGAFVTEAELFNLSGLIEEGKVLDLSSHVEGFAESAATLGMMKGSHALPKLATKEGRMSLIADVKARYNSPDYESKARFTREELADLKAKGYDLKEVFRSEESEGGKGLKGENDLNELKDLNGVEEVTPEVIEKNRRKEWEALETYQKMQADDRVPLGVKAKMAYYVEGKMAVNMPKATRVDWNKSGDGYVVETYDAMGRLLSRKNFARKDVKEVRKLVRELELACEGNSFSILEDVNDRIIANDAEARAAYDMAEGSSVEAKSLLNRVREIQAKADKDITDEERRLLTSFEVKRARYSLHENSSETIKSQIENETGLKIEDILSKPASKRSLEEVAALAKYRRELMKMLGVEKGFKELGVRDEELGVENGGKGLKGERAKNDLKELSDLKGVEAEQGGKGIKGEKAVDDVDETNMRPVDVEDAIKVYELDEKSSNYIRKNPSEYASVLEELEADRAMAHAYAKGEPGSEAPEYWDYWKARDGLRELGVRGEELGVEQGGKDLKGENDLKEVKAEASEELGVRSEELGVEKGGKGLKGEKAIKEVRDLKGGEELQELIKVAEAEVNTTPTEGQKKAGNYKKGHVQIGNFNITIEQPKGSVRSGVDANGNKWETVMQNTYGYIRGTEGVDGDHIDVFLSDDIDGWDGRNVFVIDQYNEDGSFDEHKVMLGFNEAGEAHKAYLSNYSKDWSQKHKNIVTSVYIDDFDKWINQSHRKTKAFAEYKGLKGEKAINELGVRGEELGVGNGGKGLKGERGEVDVQGRAGEWSAKTGEVVRVVERVEDITNAEARAAIESGVKVKGWYDTKSGEVVIYAPNVNSVRDVDLTVIHEAVSHKGLRDTLGKETYDRLCDKTWEMMDEDARAKYENYPGVGNIKDETKRRRAAADEYIAGIAEKEEANMTEAERSVWKEVVKVITDFIKKIFSDAKITEEDIRQIIRASYRRMVEKQLGVRSEELGVEKGGKGLKEVRDLKEDEVNKANKANVVRSRVIDAKKEIAKRLEKDWSDAPTEVREEIKRLSEMSEPIDVEDVVYERLENLRSPKTRHKLVLSSEGGIKGVSDELGLPAKELQRMVGFNAFALPKNGGVSLQKMAESIAEDINDGTIAGISNVSESVVRDMLIEAIRSAGEPADISYHRARRRMEMAQKIYEDWKHELQAEEARYIAEEDAYNAYEENWLIEQEKMYEMLPKNFLENIFADEERLRQEEYEQRSRTIKERNQGSGKVLLGEQSSEQGGTRENEHRQGVLSSLSEDMSRSEDAVAQGGETRGVTEREVRGERELGVRSEELGVRSEELGVENGGKGGKGEKGENRVARVEEAIREQETKRVADKIEGLDRRLAEIRTELSEDKEGRNIQAQADAMVELYGGYANAPADVRERIDNQVAKLSERRRALLEEERAIELEKKNTINAFADGGGKARFRVLRADEVKDEYKVDYAGDTLVVIDKNDLTRLKSRYSEQTYKAIEEFYNKEGVYGVSLPKRRDVIIFKDKTASEELTWWHEQTHVIYEELSLENKEEAALAAMNWLRDKGGYYGQRHYEEIVEKYSQEDWASESAARLIEYIVDKYGAKRFLSENFEGNGNVLKLANAIRNKFIYGTEEPTRSDILRREQYTTGGGTLDRRGESENTSQGRFGYSNTSGRDTGSVKGEIPEVREEAGGSVGGIGEGGARFRVEELLDDGELKVGLRKLEKGETSHVERVFTENKNFEFTTKNTIESYDDVAYIFKELENEAVENTFVALVKEGKPTVIHLGMGTATASMVDFISANAAVGRINPDKIYFVHNHPSGILKASQQDMNLLDAMKDAFGEDVVQDGIIIDTFSGKYGTFGVYGDRETSDIPSEQAEIPIQVYSFSKSVYDKNHKPSHTAKTSADIAAFITSQRLGDRAKIGLIVANNQLQIVGNIFLPYSEFTNENVGAIANDIAYYTSVMGGNQAFLFGNAPLNAIESKGLTSKVRERANGQIGLLDYISLDGGRYESANDANVRFSVVKESGDKKEKHSVIEPQGLTTIVVSTKNAGAKIITNKDKAKENLAGIATKYRNIQKTRGFIGDLKRALGETKTEGQKEIAEKVIENVIVDKDAAPSNRQEAIARLSAMEQPFLNKDQNVEIYASNRDARHIMQFRNSDQIAVVGSLPTIIERAVKIGELPVAQDEQKTTKTVSVYYCPIKVGEKQYSGRMIVKEYYVGTQSVDELHLYNVMLKKSAPVAQNVSPEGLPIYPTSADVYKVKDLIHNTQEHDKVLLGLEGQTRFRVEGEKGGKGEKELGVRGEELGVRGEGEERAEIETRAKASGTYMKAPNGKASKLDERQWIEVRTKAFKEWFGNWEKVARIEKLRASKPVEITGDEIESSKDLKEYKSNALVYGKQLRGSYTNKDTKTVVEVNAQSIKEVLHHDYKNIEHLQSVAAIPQIIEDSIYIDTVENEYSKENSKVKEYQYYVCGLKIGNVDYTVKSVIAVDNNGNRYYDHKLTEIEKGKLLDELDRITNPSSQEESPLIESKDKRLVSILQADASKILDENGEPMVIKHMANDEFTKFDVNKIGTNTDPGAFGRGFYFSKYPHYGLYGDKEMKVFLDIKNPLKLNSKNWVSFIEDNFDNFYEFSTKERSAAITEYCNRNGYDGVWYEDSGTMEVVAFRPNQIKSATDNEGSYSRSNDDIRFRVEEDYAPVWGEGESYVEAEGRLNRKATTLSIEQKRLRRRQSLGKEIDEARLSEVEAELAQVRKDLRYLEDGPMKPELAEGESETDESYVSRMDAWHRAMAEWNSKKWGEDSLLDEALREVGEMDINAISDESVSVDEEKANLSVKEMKRMIKEQIRERRRGIEVSNWQDEMTIHDIKGKTTEEQRKLIPHILEGSYPEPRERKDRRYADYLSSTGKNDVSEAEWSERKDILASNPMAVDNRAITHNQHGARMSDIVEYAVDSDAEILLTGDNLNGLVRFGNGDVYTLDKYGVEYALYLKPEVWQNIMTAEDANILGMFLRGEAELYAPQGLREYVEKKEYGEGNTLDVVNEIRGWYDEAWSQLEAEGMTYHKQALDNYVTHIWDLKKSSPTAVTTMQKFMAATAPKELKDINNYIATNTPYVKERAIGSIRDGEALGLVPKYEDITDIMRDYGHRMNEARENRRLVNFVKTLRVNGMDAIREEGGRSGGLYVPIKNEALRGYEVHRDVKPVLDVIFGDYHTTDNVTLQKLGHLYDTWGGLLKKVNLSMSFFHHGALTETAIAMTNPYYAGKTIFKNILWDAAFKGQLPAFNDMELTKEAVSHFVQLGATSDYATKEVQALTSKFAEWAEGKAGAEELATILDFWNKGMDTALWNYLHDGLKVYGYSKLANEIKAKAQKEGWSEDVLNRALDEAGQLINDTYGGQHWELLGVSPNALKWARRAFLSPDWTLSTLRQALAPFGVGQMYDNDKLWRKWFKDDPVASVRKRYGRAFWVTAALFFGGLMNGLNVYYRMKDEDEENAKAEEIRKTRPEYKSCYELAYPDGMRWWDYTMLGNTMGHETHLFGGRYEDGKEQYVRWGKQFRELPELFYGRDGLSFPQPMIDKITGKLNPMINLMSNLSSGYGLSGFQNEYMKNKRGWDREFARLQVLVTAHLPYSIPTDEEKEFKAIDLMMPSTKGFSNWKAIDRFKTAIMSGDMDFCDKVYDACVKNGLEADNLLDVAIKQIEVEAKRAMVEGVTDLNDAVSQYDKEENPIRKKQLAGYIKKQLSAQDYKEISKEELREKAYLATNGGVSDKNLTIYDKLSNSNDVIEDWRITKGRAGLKQYADGAKAIKEESADPLVYAKYIEDNGRYIRQYNQLGKVQSEVNKLKKLLGTGKDAEVMAKIREVRKKAFSAKGQETRNTRLKLYKPKPDKPLDEYGKNLDWE